MARLAFFLFLFIVSALLVPQLVHCYRTGHWVPVKAEIVGNEIREFGRNKSGTRYLVDLRYRYRVDGVMQEGSMYDSFGSLGEGDSLMMDEAEALAEVYRVGAPLVVYHNPKKPSEAVISPGFSGYRWVPAIFFVVLVVAQVAVAWPMNRKRRR